MTAPRLLALTLLAGAVPALAAPIPAPGRPACPNTIDVRNVMTVTQFEHAGLDKLSKKQIAALNRWLGNYIRHLCVQMQAATPATASAGAASTGRTAGHKAQAPASPAAATAGEAAFGKPPTPPSQPTRIESHIVGRFHGWTGDTIFRLQNGQVWKQAGPGYFETDLKNPKVVIKKLLIGYVLQVHGYAKEVFVRRIH